MIASAFERRKTMASQVDGLGTLTMMVLACSIQAANPANVVGVGTESCGAFLAARGQSNPGSALFYQAPDGSVTFDKSYLFAEWINGFLSLGNLDNSNKAQIDIDFAGIDLWLRQWCEARPTKRLVDAALAFTAEQRRH